MGRTAAALIIGNEILSGKIREENIAYLGKELFLLGIPLQRVVVCVDDVDVIATDVNALRKAHDVVFTSGGIGPTHDDVTLEAIAKAFGVPLERSKVIAGLIHKHNGEDVTDAHLRMADVPEGADLLRSDEMPWPTVAMENVYMFPGVPEIFRMKFPVVRQRLAGDDPFHTRAVFTNFGEGEIAKRLGELADKFDDLSLGSYPTFRNSEYRTKITFDGRDRDRVEQAMSEFLGSVDSAGVVRVE